MTKVYGLDLEGDITPEGVRDAMVECFFEAHCAGSGSGLSGDIGSRDYCETVIRKAFQDVDGSFDNPTKESIVGVLGELQKIAKNFKSQDVIKRHAEEIMALVDKL